MSDALRRVNHTQQLLACCVKHNNHNIETTTEHRKLSSDVVDVVGRGVLSQRSDHEPLTDGQLVNVARYITTLVQHV